MPGHGTIATPYAEQAFYPPARRWIGMTGTDGQTYGLVYAAGGFTAYGNGNWIMSQREVTLRAGRVVLARARHRRGEQRLR